MADVIKAIEDMEEIISYFRAVTSTSDLEQKARNVYKFLKEQYQIILCKECKYGYQDDVSLSLGTVRCGKSNCFKLEDWYCGDGKPKED